MKRWLQTVVVMWLLAAPTIGAATEPAQEVLAANWVLDVPVTGEHAVALIQKVTGQVDQADFAEGEWREFRVGISDVHIRLTLLHRYDGAASDFPVPAAGAEEWSLRVHNSAYAATVEWTTEPTDRKKVTRVYSKDDRLQLLPRFAADPRVAMQAAIQHARLDALHTNASLTGVLRGGHAVWGPASGSAFDLTDRGQSILPRLLIVSSGYNTYRSAMGRDALMGPECVGWQTCGEQRGVTASK